MACQGLEDKYYYKTGRFNLRAFWAAHKNVLPIHYGVYVAEVGCKKAAAANVESVFSGAGKFSNEARSVVAKLLERIVKLHYNWKYVFLRPSMAQIIARYKVKFGGDAATATAPVDPPAPA